jgi:hypothetical protein
MILEVVARSGVDFTFFWTAPVPLNGDPTITVRHPTAGDITPAVTQLRADATISAVAADRKTLTVGDISAGNWQGLQGDVYGHAFVLLDRHGWYPVRVSDITASTTVVLAEPLPASYTAGTADTLQWATWYCTYASATVTASASSTPIPFTVAYTHLPGNDITTALGRQEGLLYVVRQPFDTGLDEDGLLAIVPGFAQIRPGRQTSYAPQMDAAKRMLVRWIRRHLKEQGADQPIEHAVNGGAFLEVHAFLTVASYLDGLAAMGATDRFDIAAGYRERARDLFDDIMACIPWVDLDADGVVDSGEVDLEVGLTATVGVDSLFDGGDSDFTATNYPNFSRRQDH